MRLLKLLLVLLVCAAGPAGAETVEEATAAFFRLLADQGSADAQVLLGQRYITGIGVPKDAAAGVSWFRKAADQGDASGQNHLGAMYGAGIGVRHIQRVNAVNPHHGSGGVAHH